MNSGAVCVCVCVRVSCVTDRSGETHKKRIFVEIQIKVKFFQSTPWRRIWQQRYSSASCKLRHRTVISIQIHAFSSFTPGENKRRYLFNRTQGEPQGRCAHFGKRKIFALAGYRTLDVSARSLVYILTTPFLHRNLKAQSKKSVVYFQYCSSNTTSRSIYNV